MNERHVPVFLVGSAVRCLIVGGGTIAGRKAQALLDAGAQVVVVSPDVTPRLLSLAKHKAIEWIRGLYRTPYLKGKNLVIGATNDARVNERVFHDASRLGILVNIVDDPSNCTFIVPSVVRKGRFQVAVSTGGAAPALAARLRREIGDLISGELLCMAAELGKMRPEIKLLDAADKKRFWQSVLSLRMQAYRGKPALLRHRLRAIRAGLSKGKMPSAPGKQKSRAV